MHQVRPRRQREPNVGPLPHPLHRPGLHQQAQMARQARLRLPQDLGEIHDAERAPARQGEQPQPCRLGAGAKGEEERFHAGCYDIKISLCLAHGPCSSTPASPSCSASCRVRRMRCSGPRFRGQLRTPVPAPAASRAASDAAALDRLFLQRVRGEVPWFTRVVVTDRRTPGSAPPCLMTRCCPPASAWPDYSASACLPGTASGGNAGNRHARRLRAQHFGETAPPPPRTAVHCRAAAPGRCPPGPAPCRSRTAPRPPAPRTLPGPPRSSRRPIETLHGVLRLPQRTHPAQHLQVLERVRIRHQHLRERPHLGAPHRIQRQQRGLGDTSRPATR